MTRVPFAWAALLVGALAGCAPSEGGTDAKAGAAMRDGFTNRPDPSTLPPAQQKAAADMKAMAARMRTQGPAGGIK